MPVSITIDFIRCNSCGSCVEICPEVFRISEATERAEVLVDSWEKTPPLENAVSLCPTDCIELDPTGD
ncbi:ferredoxin [Thermodesulfobacteriota bacterium]